MSTVTERFFEVLDLTGETATTLSKKIPDITTKQKLSNARNGSNAAETLPWTASSFRSACWA